MALTLGSIARKHFAMGLFVNFFHKKGQKNKKGGPVARTPTPMSVASSVEARSRLSFVRFTTGTNHADYLATDRCSITVYG